MEKVEIKKSPKKHGADFGLRILAVIIAVIIWFFLSITEYPTINKTITNVPVVFSAENSAASEKGLQIRGYKDITVDVEIKGMNYEIGSYSANDLVATINADSVTREGTYPLEITVKSTHSSDRVTVVSVKPDTVDVDFVHISTDRFNVSPSIPNVSAASDLILRTPTVSPDNVLIEGAESDLKKIARVEARAEDEITLSEAQSFETERIVLYDADNNELDRSKYTLVDAKHFDINVDVYKKKTLELTVDFTDCPSGFDASTIPYKLSENQIKIITPKLDDSDIQTLTIGSVSLAEITDGKTYTFNVDQKLSAGEINQSGISDVELSFLFSENNYIKKEFNLPSSSIIIKNVPSNKTASVEAKQLRSVVMFGPKSDIEKLETEDISAVVDLTDTASVGSVTRSVSIWTSSSSRVWCVGEYEVQVDISEKSSERSSSSSNQ